MIQATSQCLLLAAYKYPRVQKEVHYRSSSLSFTSLHKTCLTFHRYSELLLDMMLFAFTSSALVITLLVLSTRDTKASCLPCQPPSKRVNIARGASIPISRRGVWSPKITSPTLGTVWTGNENVRVTWDVSSPPSDITNPNGKLVLGYVEDGSDNEHLQLDPPLAAGFDIRNGFVDFKVPQVEDRNDYIVVLFGDSGNRSPAFTIKSNPS